MIDDFFLIANNNNRLHKLCFKAKLINIEYVDYTNTISNLSTVFSEPSPNISDEIKKMYSYKTNDLKIFFKHQIEFIKFNNQNGFTKEHFDTLFSKTSIFFLNTKYEGIDPTKFDEFRYIRIPSSFITEIDTSIEKCNTILKYIETNYNSNIVVDFELLRDKNRLLATQDVYNIDKLIDIIKKREKLSYMIFDMDIDISNNLIQLYDLKFNKFNTVSVVDINKKLSKITASISMIEKELNLYKK
jgi:hypothetical protein